MVKILMRADTHINITVPGTEPKAKCTWTQVCDITVLQARIKIINVPPCKSKYVRSYMKICIGRKLYSCVGVIPSKSRRVELIFHKSRNPLQALSLEQGFSISAS